MLGRNLALSYNGSRSMDCRDCDDLEMKVLALLNFFRLAAGFFDIEEKSVCVHFVADAQH